MRGVFRGGGRVAGSGFMCVWGEGGARDAELSGYPTESCIAVIWRQPWPCMWDPSTNVTRAS